MFLGRTACSAAVPCYRRLEARNIISCYFCCTAAPGPVRCISMLTLGGRLPADSVHHVRALGDRSLVIRPMSARADASTAGRQAPTSPPPSNPAWTAQQAGSSRSRTLSGDRPPTVPLKAVVADAVQRWFADALIEARAGDVKAQALVAQMYAEGYGCEQDLRAAKEWADRARKRGYRMSGVYCEL